MTPQRETQAQRGTKMTVFTLTHVADDPTSVFPTQPTEAYAAALSAVNAAMRTASSYFMSNDGEELNEAQAVARLQYGEPVYYGPVKLERTPVR